MAFDDLPDQGIVQGLGVGQGLYNGLVFGEGTDWITSQVENLLGYESRISDVPLPQRDGDLLVARWAAGRIVVVPFLILGDGAHADRRLSWLAAFEASDPRREHWLVFKDHGGRYMVRCRVARRRVEQNVAGARSLSAPAVVELKLADPRIYDADAWLQSALPPFGVPVFPGFNLPVAQLPINMSAPSNADNLVENTGQTTAYPVIRVTAVGSNMTAFELTNITTGETVEVNTTVNVGQTLIIDMDGLARGTAGPHIHIEGASRYGSWVHPRTLWGLVPGFNYLQAAATGGTPVARLDWLQPTL